MLSKTYTDVLSVASARTHAVATRSAMEGTDYVATPKLAPFATHSMLNMALNIFYQHVESTELKGKGHW